MEFTEVIKNRYSCKKYADKKVDAEKIEAILEAGRLAPTAKNLQEQRIYAATTATHGTVWDISIGGIGGMMSGNKVASIRLSFRSICGTRCGMCMFPIGSRLCSKVTATWPSPPHTERQPLA